MAHPPLPPTAVSTVPDLTSPLAKVTKRLHCSPEIGVTNTSAHALPILSQGPTAQRMPILSQPSNVNDLNVSLHQSFFQDLCRFASRHLGGLDKIAFEEVINLG